MPNLDSGGAGVRLTAALLLSIFPDAPDTLVDAFVEKQGVLLSVGVNKSRQRLAYFFAGFPLSTASWATSPATTDDR